MEELGRRCLAQQDYQQALHFFLQKSRIDPDNMELQHLILHAKYKMNPDEAARIAFQKHLVQQVIRETNYYRILGIDSHASDAEIAKSYRGIVFLLHPDKNPCPQAGEAFGQAQRAFEVLSDPCSRKVYDASLRHVNPSPKCNASSRTQLSQEHWPIFDGQAATVTPSWPASKLVRSLRDEHGVKARPASASCGARTNSYRRPMSGKSRLTARPDWSHLDRDLRECKNKLGEMKLDCSYHLALGELRSLKGSVKIGGVH